MDRTTPHDHPTAEGEPLYRRIATELLGEPRDGTVPPGERLPGERRPAGHFGVSRETVRQALELLRRDGLVATDRRGSHAALPGLPVETPTSLTFPVGARAATPGTVARATMAWEPASPHCLNGVGGAPIPDRADGTAAAQLWRAYDWMRRAGLTLHHRDAITRLASTPSVRVTRRVHDQYARPLEITDLVVDAQRDALVYEFTLPGRTPTPSGA
ncbi:GntR family transcriptional regulator [Streptomyces coeruleorubidus]|uniref:GntR family transcriptional regulator n=1 Tax=Streptomyces coeruleorubidus TaxID=116188 RepID=UPI00237F5C4B|nr:GntR family transcriptional regulator [Streptomyces coeruleorubidus]WDV49351.1 GntR family transcriptional regulator [Streptomyces coeruleorubidus]